MLKFSSSYLVVPTAEERALFGDKSTLGMNGAGPNGAGLDGAGMNGSVDEVKLIMGGEISQLVLAQRRHASIIIDLPETVGAAVPVSQKPEPKIVEPPRVIPSFQLLVACVKNEVMRWSNDTGKNTIFISLDGLSGSGKTTLTRAVQNVVSSWEAKVKIIEFGVDDFINTDRSSILRQMKNTDPRIFWELFTSRMSLYAAVKGVSVSGGRAFNIGYERRYRREIGKVVPDVIEIPGGRKIVFIDGVNSTSIVEELGEGDDHVNLKIMLATTPSESMRRAVNRDVKAGRKRKNVERNRPGEYKHMVPQILLNSLRADLIYCPD